MREPFKCLADITISGNVAEKVFFSNLNFFHDFMEKMRERNGKAATEERGENTSNKEIRNRLPKRIAFKFTFSFSSAYLHTSSWTSTNIRIRFCIKFYNIIRAAGR